MRQKNWGGRKASLMILNNPKFYQWEDHDSNISHKNESKDRNLGDLIQEMKEFEKNSFRW